MSPIVDRWVRTRFVAPALIVLALIALAIGLSNRGAGDAWAADVNAGPGISAALAAAGPISTRVAQLQLPGGVTIRPSGRAGVNCGANAYYDPRKKRCQCRSGYRMINGSCRKSVGVVPPPVSCKFPRVYSAKRKKCVCAPGWLTVGKTCIKAKVVVPKPTPKPTCGANQYYSKKQRKCLCVKGYVWSGNQCVRQVVTPVCGSNQYYSKKQRKCLCVKGFEWSGNKCVRRVVTPVCGRNQVYSKKQRKCVCVGGYRPSGNGCVRIVTPRPQPGPQPAPTPVVNPIPDIQRCLKQLGHYYGAIDGVAGRGTIAAWNRWLRANRIAPSRRGLQDVALQTRLQDMCRQEPSVPAPAPVEEPPVTEAVQYDSCVQQDIYDLLVATYGPRPDLKVCQPTCLPIPDALSDDEIRSYESRFGINWCRSCIKLGAYLPLDDILKIEKAGNLTLCGAPTTDIGLCAIQPTVTVSKTYTKVRKIYRNLPPAVGNERKLAVIMRNADYKNLPGKSQAERDGGAMFALLTEQLGYRETNIIDLRNATLEDMERVFGSADNPQGELHRRVRTRGITDVTVYVSSKGITSQDSSESYLLPVDAELGREAETGYPMSQFYDNLGKLGIASIMLILEADFGRDLSDLILSPNPAEGEVKVLPVKQVPGLNVFKASDRNQRTLIDPEFGVGLFTRYMIEGLSGHADQGPLGNGDRQIDSVELYAYAANKVRLAASKSFGVQQKPIIGKTDNIVLSRLQRE